MDLGNIGMGSALPHADLVEIESLTSELFGLYPKSEPPKKKKKFSIQTKTGTDDMLDQVVKATRESAFNHVSGMAEFKDQSFSLRIPSLIFPKSAYQGNEPNMPIQDERAILRDIWVCSMVNIDETSITNPVIERGGRRTAI